MDSSTKLSDADIKSIQEEEIAAIEAIYGNDFHLVESKSNAWQVCTSNLFSYSFKEYNLTYI